MKHSWLLIILFFSFNSAYSQNKFEKESRVKSSEVSTKAKSYVESIFPESNKIKWYLEENLDGMAIEAKVKANQTLYSIKFDTLGNLQDVEFIQSFAKLPEQVQEKVVRHFEENYDRHRIRKIQIQWIGDPELLRSAIMKETDNQEFEVNYEIEFRAKKNGENNSFEALFSENGELIKTDKIIPRNLNHLIY